MAVANTAGEHLAKARELLTALEPVTNGPSHDAQVRATTAAAQATLALAEQVALLRTTVGQGLGALRQQ